MADDVSTWPRSQAEFTALSLEQREAFLQQYQTLTAQLVEWFQGAVESKWVDMVHATATVVQDNIISKYADKEAGDRDEHY